MQLRSRSKSIKTNKKINIQEVDTINSIITNPSTPKSLSLTSDYHIGCSGWSYKDWKKKFYKNVPTKDHFKIYARNFETVEINNTFYKWPNAEVIKKWRDESPSNFIFTIKAPRMFTHTKARFEDKDKLNQFYKIISALDNKLGCVLFQFPPYCQYDRILLNKITDNVDLSYKNVIEFRHHSWWNENVFKTFKNYNLIFCNFSSNLQGITEVEIHHTANDLYIRFHGKGGEYSYSDDMLKIWTEKIKKEVKPKFLWVYFNNDLGGHAVYNALKFKELLKK